MNNYVLTSTAASHFTTDNAIESESIPGLRGDGNGYIKNVGVKSKQNLDYRVELYDKNSNIIAMHAFAAADAQYDGSTYYYYQQDVEWPIPLTVPNTTVELGIRNLSSTPKTAYASGGALILVLHISKG